MKNLTIYNQEICKLSKRDKFSQCRLSRDYFCCNDLDNDDMCITTEDGIFRIPSDQESPGIFYTIPNNLCVVGMVSFMGRIYYAFENGDISCFEINDSENLLYYEQLQLKINCMVISPDEDIFVVVTQNGFVILLDVTLQILLKVDLHAFDFGEKQFVTVGWGKKETQFHGSEGKAAAKLKQTVLSRSETDDGCAKVTWRDDSSMFAVSFINQETGTRQFKVFNREGALQYTSELLDGLEENIAWKPSGNLIATTQRQPNKHVVALFEKNGLKHREFVLPSNLKLKIKDLLWSKDSEILAIWSENRETGENLVHLWTEGNYHWYLKQTFKFNKESQVRYISWSSVPKSGNKLIILTDENLITYTFHWIVNHTRGNNSTDQAIVGVIDGNKALITNFKEGIVPPPMCQETLKLDTEINAILFAPIGIKKESLINSNALICVLDNCQLALYVDANESYLKYKYVKTYKIKWSNENTFNEEEPMSYHHFLWFKENIILCAASNSTSNMLVSILLEDLNNPDATEASIKTMQIMDVPTQHIVPSADINSSYIIGNGQVFVYDELNGLSLTDVLLPEVCTKVEIIKIEGKNLVISLSEKRRLFIDGKEVCNNCTSFYVHSDFLLITTLQHSLICFPLNKRGIEQIASSDLTIKPWENGKNEIEHSGLNIRRVERGSILVVAIPKDAQTILQMPRGNLECIQPRALSLHIIGHYIDNQNYKAAFDLMRKQRINLNLIYDHDPSSFIENATKFVNNVDNPSWLSLFLSELKDEDVTQTTYASSYQERNSDVKISTNQVEMKPKLEKICDILRNIMEERTDSNRFIQPILISLVKKQQTVAFEDALRKLKQIKNKEFSAEQDDNVSAEEALKYLLFLVDVNVLFDTALGMYDFDLTMFIGQRSQKDPKEYIPFLNQLKNLEENYMKFSIDKHLKRYTKALEHISKIDDKFSECMEFIKKHNLYMKGLTLFNVKSAQYREIAKAFGEYLTSKSNYREAAIMFHKANCPQDALKAHLLAGNWQDVIIAVVQLKLSLMESYEIYENLVSRLKDNKKYKEAAEVLMNHLKKSEDAVAVLCEGKAWREALKETYCMKRLDLIETHVNPGVHEHAKDLIQHFERTKEEFCKHKSRLSFIRTDEYKKKMQYRNDIHFDNVTNVTQGFSDLISETSSIAGSTITRTSQSSRSSGRTYKSSKNRRKHERKLLTLKEGSIYEDLALLRALHVTIVTSYAQKDEVSLVAEMLLNFNNDCLAEELNNVYTSFLTLIERAKYEIWNKKDIDEKLAMRNEHIETSQNQLSNNLVDPCIFYPPEMKSSNLGLDMFV